MYVVLILVIIALIILLFIKHKVDISNEFSVKETINIEVEKLRLEKEQLTDTINQRNEAIQRADQNYKELVEKLNKESTKRRNELTEQEKAREQELQQNYEVMLAAKRELYLREIQDMEKEREKEWEHILQVHAANCQNLEQLEAQLRVSIASRRKDYEGLIAPIRALEKEKQERLFWCIQISEIEQTDIHYLLTVVAPQVRNRDVIPKLVWTEYLQKPTQELMKRVKIEDKPGIYKITNINTNKCYVGKSTKVRQRLIDHIKGSVGISTIADQRIHHAMLDEGLWNWTFELVCECEKDELNEKEKFYIDFFNATDYGYNIRSGG